MVGRDAGRDDKHVRAAALCYVVALKKIPVSVVFSSRSRRATPSSGSSRTLLWNEPFGWPQLAGLALIGGGIVLIHQH